MSKKMLIDASVPDETRVVLAGDNGKILDVDFDNVERRQIKSNIYLARVTRVEPSLQAAFVDYGGNRHGFLPFSEIHPDYFQIPIADRERLMEEAREHRESKRRSKDPIEEPSDDETSETKGRSRDGGKDRRRNDKRSTRTADSRRRRRPSIAADGEPQEAGTEQPYVEDSSAASANDDVTQGSERLDLPVYQDDSEQPHVAMPQENEGAATSNDDGASDARSADDKPQGSMPLATRPEDLADSLSAEVQDGQIETTADADDDAHDNPQGSTQDDETEAGDSQAGDEDQGDEDQGDEDQGDEDQGDEDQGEPSLAAELEQMIEPRGRTRRRPGQKAPRRSKSNNKSDNKRQAEGEASADDADTSEAAEDDVAETGSKARETKGRRAAKPSKPQAETDEADGQGFDGDLDDEDEDAVLAKAYRNGDEGEDTEEDEDDDKDDAQDEVRLSHAFLARRYKIQEVIKRRQIMLIQINKEERGNKGAALTTYLSLPGRYCVLMPNTPKGGGISRKISNPRDRRKLKQILEELNLPTSLSVIVRTAGSKQDKPEIQRDYDYLLRTWDEIRKTTLESTAPALIYEEGNIIKRAVRDMYTTDCAEIVVEGKRGYDIARKMMGNLMPDQLDKVRLHDDPRQSVMQVHGVEAKLEELHKPSVSLKSGGYLVINQTEALVAIDINSGKATRERSIEDTALKTNLEAADEIARQLRLRQMAGLVVIDFIDMEERKHNRQVEKRLRDALAGDRARIQVGQISSFGLLELSRQRLGPSLHEIYRSTCEHCGGLGHVRGSSAVVRAILRSLESAMRQQDDGETIALTCSTRLGMDLLNNYRRQLGELEDRYGLRIEVRLNGDFHAEDFSIEGSDGDGSKPAARARRRSDDQDAKETKEERRTRPSRAKDERPSKAPEEAREDEDEASEDEDDEDSKARRRRGRRGGRKRRRSDEDGDLDESDNFDSQAEEADGDDGSEASNGRGGRNGRRGRGGQRNGRRRDERRVFFARSFDELLNTDREPRDRRQRNQEPRGERPGREEQAPAFAESFDTLLNTDQELRDRRTRNDRRRRDQDGTAEGRNAGRDKRRNRRGAEPRVERQDEQEQATQDQVAQDQVVQNEPVVHEPVVHEQVASNSTDAPAVPEVAVGEVAVGEDAQANLAPVAQATEDRAAPAPIEASEAPADVETEVATEVAEPNPDAPPRAKRKGWWSLGR